MTESPKPGRRAISLKEKLRIIQRIEKGEKQSAIARDLNLSKSTVNTIWKSRGKFKERIESQDFRNEAKRLRLAKQRDVDQALSEWFKEKRNNDITVTRAMLMKKAKEFVEELNIDGFEASSGFLDRWKARHGVSLREVKLNQTAASKERPANEAYGYDVTEVDCRGQEFLGVHDGLETTGLTGLTGPVSTKKAAEDRKGESGKGDQQDMPVPTLSAYLSALETVRRFVLAKSAPGTEMEAVEALEHLAATTRRFPRQAQISETSTQSGPDAVS